MKTILFLIITFNFIQCHSQIKDSTEMQKKPIEQVLKDNQEKLLSIPGVQGFYQGKSAKGEDRIVIMVDSLSEKNKDKFPDSLEGYPVMIEETGLIKPLNQKEKPSP
jgi:hypothetical protein